MTLRDYVHAAGRLVTRVLLHPLWRDRRPMAWAYLQLYLTGKGITERRELSALRSLTTPDMVIADVGANAGFYALQMAEWVGPRGRVFAFEPDPWNFALLRDRARQARYSNVDVQQIALGDESGKALLYCSAYNRADNRLSASHRERHVETYEVDVRTLDQYLSSRGAPVIDALKIDVQGAEARVLRGAKRTLAGGVRWIWVEFSPEHLQACGSDPGAFLGDLGALGMHMFEVCENGSFAPLTDHAAYINRMRSTYGDIVLLNRPLP